MPEQNCTSEFTVRNRLGLHARPASLFVQTASRFECEITVSKAGEDPADGKSLMSLLVLAAPAGTVLTVTASGPDAEKALQELGDLFARNFDED